MNIKDQNLNEIEFDKKVVTIKDLLYRLTEATEMTYLNQDGELYPHFDISINGKFCPGVDTQLKDRDTVQIRIEMLGGG